MKIIYLRSALPDLVWFRTYYEAIFPDGERHALLQRRAVERLLRENPFAGHVVGDNPEARQFPIAQTPFVMFYRVLDGRIEILRVWDGRRDPASFRY
ncbi:type II toxin-antitoxin system RelE/ParE family toxin [Rhizobium sp.]